MATNADYLNYEYGFKIIVVGDCGVGKTCVVRRYVRDVFQEHHTYTLVMESETKFEEINGSRTKLTIWDTAGQESVHDLLLPNYYRRAAIAIVMYDVTRKSTLESVPRWMNLVKNFCPENVATILVGNKADKKEEREVSYSDGEDMGLRHGIPFFETSARDHQSSSVSEAFLQPILRQLSRVRAERMTCQQLHEMGASVGRRHQDFAEFMCALPPRLGLRNEDLAEEVKRPTQRRKCCQLC